MEEKDIKQLLEFLSEKGFQGKDLEETLRSRIKSDLPEFSIDHSIQFSQMEKLTVNFRLMFRRNRQVKAYLFERYHCSCFLAPDIPAFQFGAINVFNLTIQMSTVDWESYFAGNIGQQKENETIGQLCISLINQLMESGDERQVDIARRLMFKYWPHNQLEPRSRIALEHECYRQLDFSGVPHANLSFYLLTGRLDDIYEKIRRTGLDGISGFDLHNILCENLKSNPESFILNTDYPQRDGSATINLSVFNSGCAYELDNLNIQFISYPMIEHATICGINTAALEVEMAAINWKDDHELFIFREDDVPDFRPGVDAISRQMSLLMNDPTGQVIYDLLSLKYWNGVSFFEDFIREEAWEFSESLPKQQMDFPVDIDIKVAINLLAGRSAMADKVDKTLIAPDQWMRLMSDFEGDDPYMIGPGPTIDELSELIYSLPLVPNLEHDIISQLASGERVLAEHKSGRQIQIEVDPENKTLKIFSAEGKPIPVNIHFDPDWQPPAHLLEQRAKNGLHHWNLPAKRRSDTSRNLRP